MRGAARGFAWLALGGLLGGCDVLWAPYIYPLSSDISPPSPDMSPPSPDMSPPSPAPLCDRNDSDLVFCLTFENELVNGSMYSIPITGGPVPGYGQGQIGQAANFAVTTPPVVLGDSPAWNLREFTFEAWVRPDALPTGNFKRFGLMDRQGAYSVFLDINVSQSDLALNCATNDASLQGLTIPIGTFSHVACTFKSGEQILYLNGMEGARGNKPVQTPASGPLTHYLGSNVQTIPRPESDSLVGELDELRFFSKSRTAFDIRTAYERGVPAR